jgi:hypothetical protein
VEVSRYVRIVHIRKAYVGYDCEGQCSAAQYSRILYNTVQSNTLRSTDSDPY